MFWRAFSQSYRVAMCISALRSDDVKLARFHFDKINVGELSNPRIIALGARISLLQNDTPAARLLLERALALAHAKTSDRHRYVVHYCRYFLELIERSNLHERERKRALALRPGSLVLDTLPLPSEEITLAEVDEINDEIRAAPTVH